MLQKYLKHSMATTPYPSQGDRRRAPREHDAGVRAMFDRIAPQYDRINRLITGGLDKRWRRRAIEELRRAPRGPRLDLCAGTLDFAGLLSEAWPDERVVAVDLAEEMMKRGREKAPRAETVVADVCALPFGDASFAAATCGFGVRNVSDVEAFAREAFRVLEPRGILVVLEAFRPARAIPAFLHRAYVGRAFPALGKMFLRERDAFDYFVASVGQFMTRRDFEALLRDVGFCAVRGREMTFGVSGLVVAEKPK
jgi:ubiquinone/menaquinone biosynthesis methyltransferase